jgi:type I restriction enzyme S subunit
MAYKQVLLGDYFKFEKGLGYKGEFLVDDSEVGLVGIDSQVPGGGYKENSEKPYLGPYKPEHVVQSGDVIITSTDITQDGSVLGSTFMIPESTKYETLIYSGDVLKVIPTKPEDFSPEYLYNLYRVEKYRRKLAYGDTGTTVRRISDANLNEQLVPLPDVKTQESINAVIALIDQQIENNKSLAKNLEALAQAMFRSWFVDFEPVHAKSRGEKPFGTDDETAKLFPDSFEESENGLIPKGWQLSTVSNIANLLMGQSPPGSSYNLKGEGLPFFQGRTDFGSRYPSRRVFCTHPGRMANIGDVLVSVRAPVGDINQADSKCVIGRGVASIIHKSGSQVYSYCLLKNMKTQFASFNGEGTVFGAINRKDFENLKVVEPNAKIISAFEANLRNTNDFLLCKHQETLKLIQLREVLLANLTGGFTETELLGALN